MRAVSGRGDEETVAALEELVRRGLVREGAADYDFAHEQLRALAWRAQGELDRALDLTRTALELCAAQDDRHREAALRNNLADLLHAAGRPDEAMDELKRAVTLFADVGGDEPQPEVWKLARW